MENVMYGIILGMALLMDVYQPENSNQRGVVFISGSGFGFGEALGVPVPQGPAGPKGDIGASGSQGLPGTKGQDGEDGQDGNMSARTVEVNPFTFTDTNYFETPVSIGSEEVVFAYIRGYLDSGQTHPGAWFAIPTPKFVGYHYGVYIITTRWDNNTDKFRFDIFEPDGELKFVSTSSASVDINALKLVIIGVDSGASKSTHKDAVLSQLVRNHVDIKDYEAVCKFFGIATESGHSMYLRLPTLVELIISTLTMKSFRLFPFAKKLTFFTHFSSFSLSVALLCNSKKASNGQKISNFRLNAKSLNHFNN